ncbi:MAG TPA: alpha/beta hydrolase-fold protein, partial [Bryobacteraceae bacterium]|nr:alpha/beta hydrolase-fold protein [Bryobacteraceae bacterium]
KDPFDRMLVAQAQAENLPILSNEILRIQLYQSRAHIRPHAPLNGVYSTRNMSHFSVLLLGAILPLFAQPQPAPKPIQSPQVHGDGTVTFRFRDPNAKEIFVAREGGQRIAMQKDEEGVWSVTAGPWQPDLYGYGFVADGVSYMDPVNPLIKPNLLNPQSMVHIPGPGLPWEIIGIPHGLVHHHFYHSGIVGDDRDFYVYTPPGYDSKAKQKYPVFYLLHGFSDDASGWTAVGRANIILDNLISQRKAKPMLIVMPLGYGAPEIVSRTRPTQRDPALSKRNYDRFRDALFNEVMPQIEKTYRVSTDRGSRAIAGLSMGGAESLYVGLNDLDRFAWIGAFSAGRTGEDFDKTFPNLDSKANSKIRLLWIACGTEDRLITPNRKFRDWLKSKDVNFTPIETPGVHSWMVWRRNLAAFAPLLFR